MKITIYELLGMIKDGKQPKKIKYNGYLLSWDNVDKDYYCEEYDDLFTYLFTNEQTTLALERKVEILEEEKKIPEKLSNIKFENGKFYLPVGNKHNYIIREVDKVFLDKINEIIDFLKSKGE